MVALTSAIDVRYGTTPIDRVYVGRLLVWQRTTGGAQILRSTDRAGSIDGEAPLGKPADTDTAASAETEAIQTITSVADADTSTATETAAVDTGVSGVGDTDTAASVDTEARTAAITDGDAASTVDAESVATLNTVTDIDTAATVETERLSSVTRSDADTSTSVDSQATTKTGLITQRTVTIAEQSTGSSLPGDVSTAQVGDLMVCVATVNSTCSISSGWAPLFGPTHFAYNGYGIWYRFKTGQAADVPTVTYDTSDVGSVAVAPFGGVDSTTPFDAAISTLIQESPVTSITVPAVSTVTPNAVVLTGGSIDGTSTTWTLSINAGWTMRGQTTGRGRRQALASKTLAAAGSSGTAVWSQAGGSGLAMAGFVLALRPA